MTRVERLYEIIQAPHLTEKATDETGRRNAYTFRVPVDANKIEIKQAVERLFKVKVLAVNTLRTQQKVRRRGWVAGLTPAWKKAMVVLAEGQTIDVL
ncbi:MAG: 50S ribosomal protein L23 [Planctomycetia bacterium]|jgi:large subunit ribosomal protein L23